MSRTGSRRVAAITVAAAAVIAGCGAPRDAALTRGGPLSGGPLTAPPTSAAEGSPDPEGSSPPAKPYGVWDAVPAEDLTQAPQSPDGVRTILANAADIAPELQRLTWTTRPTGALVTEVPGRDAERVWWRLRGLVPVTGRWPVLLGDRDPRGEADPARTLAAAAALDLPRWFPQRARESDLETRPINAAAVADGPRYFEEYVFWSMKDSVTGEFLPRVTIALLPTPRPWEAAAFVGFGGWNDCPDDAVHVALARLWHDRWGAEVFALAEDQAELYVWDPPTSARDAAALAQQQYLYSPDSVLQGDPDVATREDFASVLIDHESWQFWWD